ncbi:peptidylprolyl isomerase [Aliifodinibius halophilus]|uniref:Peptidyl-prolyl cis-trans isomerase n=2 Tax=Fodinibius halophilus TaxID=1736908 RepID=A0A6M1T5K7_9BACT|nr:peptidylprolyl isomerase [Fodinibius halophilus]
MPNWQRLWELGREPVWTLKTEKGPISIKLNTLSAPATVAMIDSLSRTGAYNGVPFHRVIPNFVIQGGDIERGDGFGGPDFVIPTEASEHGFERGTVGIASGGTDTEGSQYFIMHQWKPHLNGRYTRFGKVIEGFRYIDRITVGDKVNTTVWGKAI